MYRNFCGRRKRKTSLKEAVAGNTALSAKCSELNLKCKGLRAREMDSEWFASRQ